MSYLIRFAKFALAFLLFAWVLQSLWFYSLPRIDLKIGSHSLRAVLADSPRSQEWGLMFRPVLSRGEGMLFVYSSSEQVCMWMKNTFIPLSVAFIRDDGVIAGIVDMKPMTRDSHCAPVPVKYALEVPQGWFMANTVASGQVIGGLPH